ncbi:MAG: RrF2 family transcriptional regulator [Desulfovermiculus sp.]|nr:RrF2 family transcriptional regulator [Desulfovermiculus sp.]
MKLTTRSRYGARLMLDLAKHFDQGPVHLKDVANREGVSVKYLEQLIIPLKKNGLVNSVQGPKGGHILARPPESISFAEIIESLETTASLVECVDSPQSCPRSDDCPTRGIWRQVKQAMYRELESISLADKI